MVIRKALVEDSKIICSYLLLAMNDIIYNFIGDTSPEKAYQFLESMIREKDNQYSYQNCWVVESEGELVAAAIVYDGGKLEKLREPVTSRIKYMFGRDFKPENETQEGEFYIDSVGVNPNQQGKGIGSRLFQFLIEEYVNKRKETLGLLVDKANPSAKRLYLKLGFKLVGEKQLFAKSMEHLQIKMN